MSRPRRLAEPREQVPRQDPRTQARQATAMMW